MTDFVKIGYYENYVRNKSFLELKSFIFWMENAYKYDLLAKPHNVFLGLYDNYYQ